MLNKPTFNKILSRQKKKERCHSMSSFLKDFLMKAQKACKQASMIKALCKENILNVDSMSPSNIKSKLILLPFDSWSTCLPIAISWNKQLPEVTKSKETIYGKHYCNKLMQYLKFVLNKQKWRKCLKLIWTWSSTKLSTPGYSPKLVSSLLTHQLKFYIFVWSWLSVYPWHS